MEIDSQALPQPSPAMPRLSSDEFAVISAEHALWLKTDGKEGRRANMRDCDLTGCQLTGANLEQANLRGAWMAEMDLRGGSFREADLAEANLRGVQAGGGVSFAHANLSHAIMEKAQLTSADFSQANVMGAQLQGAALAKALFPGANLREAALQDTDAAGADFTGANFRAVNATKTNLTGAILDQADCRDVIFTNAQLKDASLKGANLRGAVLEGISFTEADFSQAIDFDHQYQVASYEQQRETLASEQETLQEREAALEKKAETLRVCKAEEAQLQALCREYAARARYLAAIWFFVLIVVTGAIGMAIAGTPLYKLKTMEIGLFAIIMIGISGLYLATAAVPSRFARLLDAHVSLRERKLSGRYTEPMTSAKTNPAGFEKRPSEPKLTSGDTQE